MEAMRSSHTRDIDFDQVHTQTNVDSDMHLRSPESFHIASRDACIIKILNNLCGLKQGGYDFY